MLAGLVVGTLLRSSSFVPRIYRRHAKDSGRSKKPARNNQAIMRHDGKGVVSHNPLGQAQKRGWPQDSPYSMETAMMHTKNFRGITIGPIVMSQLAEGVLIVAYHYPHENRYIVNSHFLDRCSQYGDTVCSTPSVTWLGRSNVRLCESRRILTADEPWRYSQHCELSRCSVLCLHQRYAP